MPAHFTKALAVVVVVLLSTTKVMAAEAPPEPKIEAGIGIAAISYPDWRGAKHRNTSVLPLPYVLYRGERLRLARDGLRIRLLDSDRASLSLAAAFSLAGDAKDNPARAGMEELLNTFQAGPVLNVSLNANPDADWRWDFRLPVLAVVATNFRRFDEAGFTAFPSLRLRHEWARDAWQYRAGANLGIELGSERHHDYFYQVRPSEATGTRPAFDARAGYGGTVLSGYLAAQRGPWGFAAYARVDSLAGTAFDDSPLLQQNHSNSVGVGLSYRFYQSRQLSRDDASE